MSETAVDQAKHALERGNILRTLKEDYVASMTSVRSLLGALDLQGFPLSQEGLGFHLKYLADQGYIEIFRARDLPGGRRKDRPGSMKPDTILFAKLLPKGLHLIDGLAPEDPGVAF